MNAYRDGTRVHVTWPNGNEATGPLTLMDNAAWVQIAGMTLLIDDDCQVEVVPDGRDEITLRTGPVFDVPVVESKKGGPW